MAGMTSIYVGVSGLQSATTSLNTTSHNLANVYTKGYTRQLSFTSDRTYTNLGNGVTSMMQVGLGVASSSTSRVRSIIIDQQYRKESGRQGFYEAGYEAVSEVETILGETEGVKFQDTIENLWSALNEMSKTPGSAVTRSEIVMYAETFMDRAKSIYNEMNEYQKNLNDKVSKTVDKINTLGDQINELNLKISGVEASVESANDLRDKRDVLLDELSKYIKISYEEDDSHYVSIKAEGVPFVTEGGVYHMATAELDGAKSSNFLSCVWPHLNGQEVFTDIENEINTGNGNDIGSLKGYILARGDFVGKYTDIPHEEDYDMATDEGKEAYNKAVTTYNKEVNPCVLTRTEALFDSLINSIVTTINDVFSPTVSLPAGVTTLTDADGNEYTGDDIKILDMTTSTGDDGEMPPEELFSRYGTDRFVEVTGDDGNTYYMYNDKNEFGSESLYTLSNIEVNQVLLEDYSKLPFKSLEGDNDMSKGAALVEAWNNNQLNLDPGNMTKLTFKNFYNEFIYAIGNTGSLFQSIAVNQAATSSQLDDARTGVTGVSSEEELTNMIKYQSAYNASSRYITTVSDMLEHLIERLG